MPYTFWGVISYGRARSGWLAGFSWYTDYNTASYLNDKKRK